MDRRNRGNNGSIKKIKKIKRTKNKSIIILTALCMIFISLFSGGLTSVAGSTGEISVVVNDKPVIFDQQPIIENGRTLVPMRAIFEAMGAIVEWDGDTQTITAKKSGIVVRLTIGSYVAIKNDGYIELDVPAKIVNGRTLVPVRFVAESLDAKVGWDEETETVIITYEDIDIYVRISDVKIALNDAEESVVAQLGEADRIDESPYDFEWHVYNSNYSRFIMVGIDDRGFVKGLYTNSRGFESNGTKYGDTTVRESNDYAKFYYDKNDNDIIHAVLIAPNLGWGLPEHSEAVKRAEEMQNFDAVNAFRANHGKTPFLLSDIAAVAARKHSQDMADNDYFSHTGLNGSTPWERYYDSGGESYSSAGENIIAGRSFGVDAFDGWVNSQGHRDNMLGNFTHIGVGIGYNKDSRYRYYFTQFFVSPG